MQFRKSFREQKAADVRVIREESVEHTTRWSVRQQHVQLGGDVPP
jgi:hypothetical protein